MDFQVAKLSFGSANCMGTGEFIFMYASVYIKDEEEDEKFAS